MDAGSTAGNSCGVVVVEILRRQSPSTLSNT
jgi:hypothetical protein